MSGPVLVNQLGERISTALPVRLRPVADRFLVKVLEETEETIGGIVIPQASVPTYRARVVEVGPGKYENGVLVPMSVKVGDVLMMAARVPELFINGVGGFMVVTETVVLGIETVQDSVPLLDEA